jgi:hypothetical protein
MFGRHPFTMHHIYVGVLGLNVYCRIAEITGGTSTTLLTAEDAGRNQAAFLMWEWLGSGPRPVPRVRVTGP